MPLNPLSTEWQIGNQQQAALERPALSEPPANATEFQKEKQPFSRRDMVDHGTGWVCPELFNTCIRMDAPAAFGQVEPLSMTRTSPGILWIDMPPEFGTKLCA